MWGTEIRGTRSLEGLDEADMTQWAGGGFDDFLNLMNFLVFLIL